MASQMEHFTLEIFSHATLPFIAPPLQLCAWSIRTATALTIASLRDDQKGTAQLSGSNAAVLSSLLSALMACQELALTGEAPDQLLRSTVQLISGFPVSLHLLSTLLPPKRATQAIPSARPHLQKVRNITEAIARGPVCKEAVAMADILQGCVHRIGTAFGEEIVPKWKQRGTNAAWFSTGGSPLFATEDDHVEKMKEIMSW